MSLLITLSPKMCLQCLTSTLGVHCHILESAHSSRENDCPLLPWRNINTPSQRGETFSTTPSLSLKYSNLTLDQSCGKALQTLALRSQSGALGQSATRALPERALGALQSAGALPKRSGGPVWSAPRIFPECSRECSKAALQSARRAL